MNWNQDFEIYPSEGGIHVRGRADRTLLLENATPAAAIQAALDACQSGGEVRLLRGEYRIDRPLSLPSGVTLAGNGHGTRIRADFDKGAAITARDSYGIVLRDLVITPAPGAKPATGIRLSGCGDCRVTDVRVAGFREHGIHLCNHTFLSHVRGCTVAANGKSNILCESLARGDHGDFIPNLIADCVIIRGGHGIECSNAIVLNISGCLVYQVTGYGYFLRDRSNSVVISGCRTFQITGSAVRVEGTDELNLSSNIFCWHTRNGIEIEEACWGTISANEVIDSGSYNGGTKDRETRPEQVPADEPLYDAITLRGAKGFTITGNAIFNWEQSRRMRHAIVEDENSSHNSVSANTINYFDESACDRRGRDGLHSANTDFADTPFLSIPPHIPKFIQSFQPEKMEAFIREQLGIDTAGENPARIR